MSGHGEHAQGPPATSAPNPDHHHLPPIPATTKADTSPGNGPGLTPASDETRQDSPADPTDPARRIPSSIPISNAMGSTAPTTTSAKTRSPPPQSLPPGSIAQAQAQFPVALTTQLQLQVNTKASATSSPPTLFLVPATPGLSGSGISKPSTADPSIPNPSTLSKHKGLPVLPYLVTPKEEKTHGTILGLWEYDDSHPSGKPPSKVAKSSKGAPSTSGSSKVVTSMGAEAGRRALLALQSVVAEEGGPISSGGPRRKASTQQLALPLQSSSLSIASAPVSPHKDRDVDSTGTGMSQNTPFESISLPATPTACENRSPCLPENGFFLAVMSVYWSNLVGPRIEQTWTPRVGCPDESTLNLLAKQILNGEVMRTTDAIEPKMVVLQDEGLIAMSYLYTANPSMTDGCSYGSTTLGTTTGTLAMSTKFVLSFVVPLVYLQNFSSFFGIMSDHAPVLIEVLRGLRAGLRLNVALDMFADEHLVPFVEDIMTMEAVAMAIEGAKASHIALGREGDQVFGREFINRAITSHLQTNSSTVVVGNNITIMNMMINTLALFLSAEDRAKSCHARKQHRYLPNLFLQGIYTPSIGKQSNTGNGIDGESGYLSRKLDRNGRLYHILSSPFPTTIVDTVRCKVEQTERLPKYSVLRSDYRKEQVKCVVERSISRVAAWNASSQAGYLYQGSVPPQSFQKNSGSDAGGFWSARRENSWTSVEWKGQKAVRQIHVAAPMVENLVRCVVGLPIEMREGYVRQWRRGLVKRALTVVKFVKKEGVELAEQLEQQKNTRNRSSDQDFVNGEDPSRPIVQSPQTIFQHLGVDSNDLSIVLGTAERILPSITEFVRVHLGVE
ncbi:C9orf72-like protein family-domain-containing protein [Dissophora ornata]|nr:C9orf72-like protein family-domain-containing protein [Dissophora ornata]